MDNRGIHLYKYTWVTVTAALDDMKTRQDKQKFCATGICMYIIYVHYKKLCTGARNNRKNFQHFRYATRSMYKYICFN